MQNKVMKYSIDEADMSSVFALLRTKLYSNPIESICREIASNSRDANREVNNKNPIEISINIINSTTYLSFKDEGPGISPDRMENVFCKYMNSTKRESSHLTGGFGLGAKTPFAYTNSFNVITNVDGKKYYYTCSLDKDNGNITLTKEEETNDVNGTTIQVPIKDYTDLSSFEKSVVYTTQFWSQRPVLKNFTYNYQDIKEFPEYGNDNIKIMQAQEYGNILALVDEIPYKVDYSKLAVPYNEIMYDKTIVFKYNKNDVSVSANRETLYFDDNTSNKIKTDLAVAKELFKKQFTDYLNSGDYLDYCIKANTVLFDRNSNIHNAIYATNIIQDKNIISLKNDNLPLYKDGSRLQRTIVLKGKGIIIEKIAGKKISQKEAKTTYTLDSKYQNRIIYWLDETRKSAEKNLTLFNENDGFFMLLTKSKNDTVVSDSFFSSIKQLLKLGFEVVRYSEIEKTKIERTAKTKTESGVDVITGIYISKNSYGVRDFNRISIKVDKETKKAKAVLNKFTDVTITDGIYVLKVDKITKYRNDHSSVRDEYPLYMEAIAFGDKPFLILNEINLKKMKKYFSVNEKMEEIFFEDKFTSFLKKYVAFKIKNKVQSDFRTIFSQFVFNSISESKVQKLAEIFDFTDEMKNTITELTTYLKGNIENLYLSSVTTTNIEIIMESFRKDIVTNNITYDVTEIKDHIAHVIKRKPLLFHTGSFSENEAMLEELKKYSYACDVLFL